MPNGYLFGSGSLFPSTPFTRFILRNTVYIKYFFKKAMVRLHASVAASLL
jgi:hypothetical protein